ncbi:hypothetical protein Verru16b_03306 [Lacunisphaera limnophila]|uniref:Lipoprotein n=1 Tax=Lacunisphaera limnophila TaxID=1838286 RepID=A0A1D8AZ89_9BACT|nr:hypothetical protein [Lacunisphaera limnophila]AOS46209.1 hypothetical protein Verru16b_03306 [Lacunisphaera limnophila]
MSPALRTPRDCRRAGPLARWAGGGLLVLAGLLAGCTGFPQAGPGSYYPTPTELQARLELEERYVYFPGYEIYYNRTQGYYVYRTHGGWVDEFELPLEVDRQEMLASPFAAMSFHDHPEAHHEQVVRDYPRNWGLDAPAAPSARTSGLFMK